MKISQGQFEGAFAADAQGTAGRGTAHFDSAAVFAQRLSQCCALCTDVDAGRLFDAARAAVGSESTVAELTEAATRLAVELIVEEPQYSQVAARLLAASIDDRQEQLGLRDFASAMEHAFATGCVQPRVIEFVRRHSTVLSAAIDARRTDELDYPGLRTLLDRFLLRDPDSGLPIEGPQQFWMRIAVACSDEPEEAIELYRVMSTLEYLPSDETLRHAGTPSEFLSSCYLLDSPGSAPDSPNERTREIDQLARASGDITVAWNRARVGDGLGPVVESGGESGRFRPGISCIYLEPWHVDIERCIEALEQFDPETGAEPPPWLSNWVPDLFMRRVEENAEWSLFDPAEVPLLADVFGSEFDAAYEAAEARGLARKRLPARELYARIVAVIAYSGRASIEFKCNTNRASNQTAAPGNTVHAANLCSEVVEVTRAGEAAVCHLGAINLARHVTEAGFDFDKLERTVVRAIRQLDAAIDRNAYLIPSAEASSRRWRPLGLGVMGLQDVFFRLHLPFDSFDARNLSTRIAEAIYFHALSTSVELARVRGVHESWPDTRAARGELQFDSWGVMPSDAFDWPALRARIAQYGLRNSLLVAIGPTASLASVAGCFETIEPQVSNLFLREVAGNEYARVNPYLVEELKQLGLWTDATRSAIRLAGGSVQGLYQLPEDLRTVFRTAWEVSTLALLDLAADRGAFVDQSQSLNLFVTAPDLAQVSRLYLYAWKCGLKTTYTLQTRWKQTDL
jgi:ribonucleoside-diphosphate reductase alpha chain